jgi:hypothetical protein
LLTALESRSCVIDLYQPDRGDDPLRKAKYLNRYRPPYFSVRAGSQLKHFDVRYRDPVGFSLAERPSSPVGELRGLGM